MVIYQGTKSNTTLNKSKLVVKFAEWSVQWTHDIIRNP